MIALLTLALVTSNFEIITSVLKLTQAKLLGKATIDEILYVLPFVYLIFCIDKAGLSVTRKRKRQELLEESAKSLYGDDIAEDHLRRTLTDLSKTGVKIVFIIDELDKIEDQDALQGVIRAIKPLMLSGLASFLLITGQSFYYKFQSIHTSDDAIIASLFSKSIHVPLLSIEQLRKLFQKLIVKTGDIRGELLESFINSIILESNRVPRRFYNLIRQRINWDGTSTYLEVKEGNEKIFQTHSILLDIIENIEQRLNAPEYKEGIKDFFISQLHLMIQKMLARSSIPFTRKVLCDTENDKLPEIPEWCKVRLGEVANALLDACVNSGMLRKGSESTESGDEEIYTWTDPADAAIELSNDDPRKVESVFVQAFSDLERIARQICLEFEQKIDVEPLDESKTYRFSIRDLLSRLVKHQFLSPGHLKKLEPVIELRNRLVHRSSLKAEELKSAGEMGSYLIDLRHQILFGFTFQILSRRLETIGYELSRSDPHYDIAGLGFSLRGSPIEDGLPDLLFELKFDPLSVAKPQKATEYMLQRATKYADKFGKRAVAIAFVFLPPGTLRQNQFQINDRPRDCKLDDSKNFVFIRMLSESRTDGESLTLEHHLDDILTTTGVSSSRRMASSDGSTGTNLPERESTELDYASQK